LRAEFARPEDPSTVVGRAAWGARGIEIVAENDAVGAALHRIFRPIPIAVDDPSLRPAGTSGPILLQPGTLRWFGAAARMRAEAEGLRARLIPEAEAGIGWDPAAAYRGFDESVDRRERKAEAARPAPGRATGEAP
jgi:hypothetical protein